MSTRPPRAAPLPLRDLQIWMVGAITGSEVDARSHDVASHVTPGPRMTASERFDVYRAGYHARLVECLLDDYPVLAAMLGEAQFGALCRAYVDRHPSSSPNLNGFGRHMASFCREARLSDAPENGGFDALRGFAAELATLEWALVEAIHAPMAPPLDVATLQAMPVDAWARARFTKSEALWLFRFEYPVNAVFIANRVDEVIPPVPAPAPNALAVYRKDAQLWRMDITPAMLGVLEPLLEGKSLGEALEAIEAQVTDPDVLAQTSANLMVWFREWVDAGFFTALTLAPETATTDDAP